LARQDTKISSPVPPRPKFHDFTQSFKFLVHWQLENSNPRLMNEIDFEPESALAGLSTGNDEPH